jgi:hypothetical protein
MSRPIVIALFCIFLYACAPSTPSILAPPEQPGCRRTEVACVDGDLRPTGYCCPETYACSGPFPNVGCGTKIGDMCCPTVGGGADEARAPVRQRKVDR